MRRRRMRRRTRRRRRITLFENKSLACTYIEIYNIQIRRIHQIIVLNYSNLNLGILLTYVAVPRCAVCVIFTN